MAMIINLALVLARLCVALRVLEDTVEEDLTGNFEDGMRSGVLNPDASVVRRGELQYKVGPKVWRNKLVYLTSARLLVFPPTASYFSPSQLSDTAYVRDEEGLSLGLDLTDLISVSWSPNYFAVYNGGTGYVFYATPGEGEKTEEWYEDLKEHRQLQEPESVMTGQLQKKGLTTGMWHFRYTVLTDTDLMSFKVDGDMAAFTSPLPQALVSMSVSLQSIKSLVTHGGGYFQVVAPSGGKDVEFKFYHKNGDLARRWVDAIHGKLGESVHVLKDNRDG